MKKLCEFSVLGFDVVPWSVPNIARGGRQWRSKKTIGHLGKLSLVDWQAAVRTQAWKAWQQPPVAVSCRVHIEFLTRTPKGCRPGQLWRVGVKQNDKGQWVKEGRSPADLCNFFKGTEDAVESVVYHNDCQTRMMSAIALYGPEPGVRVTVYEIEASDFPGDGETT